MTAYPCSVNGAVDWTNRWPTLNVQIIRLETPLYVTALWRPGRHKQGQRVTRASGRDNLNRVRCDWGTIGDIGGDGRVRPIAHWCDSSADLHCPPILTFTKPAARD